MPSCYYIYVSRRDGKNLQANDSGGKGRNCVFLLCLEKIDNVVLFIVIIIRYILDN